MYYNIYRLADYCGMETADKLLAWHLSKEEVKEWRRNNPAVKKYIVVTA